MFLFSTSKNHIYYFMKSKVLLIALATTVFAIGAKAQHTSFGVRAGINFQNLTGDDGDGHKLDNKLKTGINLGLNAEIPIAEDFYIQPGLLFSTKGAKDKTYRKVNVRLSYLEIPINLLFKPELGEGKLLLGFGPYIGIAVGGSYTDANGHKTQYKFAHKITQSEYASDPYVRRMDFGGNFLAGYELSNKLSFQLNAQLGMSNIATKVEGFSQYPKIKNTGFGVSVGYRLN
jgi:hypothetical protein